MLTQSELHRGKQTAAELLESSFPNEFVNVPGGKSHLFDGQRAACGLVLDRVNHTVDTEPFSVLCKLCERTRDWYFQGMIQQEDL